MSSTNISECDVGLILKVHLAFKITLKDYESESSRTDSVSNASLNRKTTLDSNQDEFNINISRIFDDSRSTLMLRNIPNKYSLDLLLQDLNQTMHNKYDFVNLPVDI